MAIYRIIKNSTFNPEDISAMTAAYEAALAKLGIVDRVDPRTQTIASKIVHRVSAGVDDIDSIVQFAIRDFLASRSA